jgi:hypothetical protein
MGWINAWDRCGPNQNPLSCKPLSHPPTNFPGSHRKAERSKRMAWFYEIRSSDSTVLKRYGGFATQDAAKIAGREVAKKMKNMRQPDKPDVDRILVGQNTEKPTRY